MSDGPRIPTDFDAAAYLARIGHPRVETPSLENLRTLIACHAAAIPFENIDVLLGWPVQLAPSVLQEKLVKARRGGYCFEQNGLFLLALRSFGYDVTPLAGRVLWMWPEDTPLPRTHMLLRVDLDEGPHLADVGFGGLVLTAPLKLDTELEQSTPLEPHRIVGRGNARLLQAKIDERWADVYEFDFTEQLPVDYEMANWFTSTHPESRFKKELIVSRANDAGRFIVHDNELRVRRGGTLECRPIRSPEELLVVLEEYFGIALPADTRIVI